MIWSEIKATNLAQLRGCDSLKSPYVGVDIQNGKGTRSQPGKRDQIFRRSIRFRAIFDSGTTGGHLHTGSFTSTESLREMTYSEACQGVYVAIHERIAWERENQDAYIVKATEAPSLSGWW